MGAWEDGFAAGWTTAIEQGNGAPPKWLLEKQRRRKPMMPQLARKPKRKASAYSKRYGAAFKRIAKKNKKKGGGWKKGGFARTQKAAHKAARK